MILETWRAECKSRLLKPQMHTSLLRPQPIDYWLQNYISNHLAHSAPLFAQLNILDIFKVNSLYIAKFMFSYHQRLLPSPFLNLFPTGGQVHNHDTRTSAHFRPHTYRINIKQFTILFRGSKIWNALPLSITSSPRLSIFKRKLLDFLS